MQTRHLLIFLCLLLASCSALVTRNNCTIIKNVNVFEGEYYMENTNFVFDSTGIVDITRDISQYSGKYIDGKNRTIIPPMLNAHVHVNDKKQLIEAQRNGIFALLDMHNDDSRAAYFRTFRDSLAYAYFYSAGSGATVPGGHGTQWYPVPTINDSVSPAKFTAQRIKNGADYIKILCESHFPKNVDFIQTRVVIQIAHSYKKMCVAHVSTLNDARVLTPQGIDGFVHIWTEGSATDGQLRFMKSKGPFIVPTLYVIKSFIASVAGTKDKNGDLDFNDVLAETRKAHQIGIPILAGTDAPNYNFNFGSDLFVEIKLLTQAGLSNQEALQAATVNISKAFKLDRFLGLKKGAEASFVMVAGNPIKDIDDLYNHKSIWKKGKRIF